MDTYIVSAGDLGGLWADQVEARYGCVCTRIAGDADCPSPSDVYTLSGPGAGRAFAELAP
jgi:hypothetical protein